MTARKPLEWYPTDHGEIPDCGRCLDFLRLTPFLVEAVASVAIEHPVGPEVLLRRVVEAYHRRGHPASEVPGLGGPLGQVTKGGVDG